MSKSFYSCLAFLVLACSGDKDTADGITDPEAFDVDQDGFSEADGDCDDFNNTINPDATDVPDNGIDEDCDGEDATSPDSDVDNDGDGFTEQDGDCDDSDENIHPGMTDIPDNGIDEDCDGEDATTASSVLDIEEVALGMLIITEVMPNPDATEDSVGEWFEIYNNGEQSINLNGLEISSDDGVEHTIGEDYVLEPGEYWVLGRSMDIDMNGGVAVNHEYGTDIQLTNSEDAIILSAGGEPLDRVGYDDAFPLIEGKSMILSPDKYDNALNDLADSWCSSLSAMPNGDFATPGTVNDDCGLITIVDNDGDGYEDGDAGGDDCNDDDATINPGAVDIADDGIDQDCDGADATSTSSDLDGDGYDSNVDCNDNDASINPGMLDIGQDGIDQDCDGADETGLCSDNCSDASWNGDGMCDDGGPNASYGLCGFGADCSDCGARYDIDGDGFYDDEGVGPFSPTLEMDCNDNDATINPGMLDIGEDGIDQDCDGADQEGLCDDTCFDAGDGYCDDGGPNADYQICGFGTDCTDCGARLDNDGDGFYDDEGVGPLDTSLTLDCEDQDSSVYPGATEQANDGIDQDCSGADEIVADPICEDTCATANDGVCNDGGNDAVDDTCALGTDCTDCGDRFDYDEDGYDNVDDCNDGIAAINPGVTSDTCDGIDNDCDGAIDEDLDTLEPNDSTLASYMGDLDQVGDSITVTSYITNENDEDAFSLYLFDNPGIIEQDSFNCEVTAPAGVDIGIEVLFDGSSIGTVNSQGPGIAEAFQYNATWLINDEGTYTIVISNLNGGESCDPMTVFCEK